MIPRSQIRHYWRSTYTGEATWIDDGGDIWDDSTADIKAGKGFYKDKWTQNEKKREFALNQIKKEIIDNGKIVIQESISNKFNKMTAFSVLTNSRRSVYYNEEKMTDIRDVLGYNDIWFDDRTIDMNSYEILYDNYKNKLLDGDWIEASGADDLMTEWMYYILGYFYGSAKANQHVEQNINGGYTTEGAGKTVKLPDTQFATKKLQHEFKHAGDFGIKGNWSKATGEAYQKAIKNHMDTATNVYKSTYRGQDVFVHINKNTGLGTYTDLSGNYVGGWEFSTEQMNFHITNGSLIK